MEPFDFSNRRPLDEEAAEAMRDAFAAGAVRSGLILASLLKRASSGTCGPLVEPHPGELQAPDRYWLRCGDLLLAPTRGTLTGLAEIFMGAPPGLPDRPPTALELAVLLPRLSDVLADLPAALGMPRASAVEPADPDVARHLGPVVVAPLVLTVEPVEYELPVVLARSGVVTDDQAPPIAPGGIEQAVAQVPLVLDVTFDLMRLPALELDELEVGDVLRLDHQRDVPLTASVAGRPMLRVVPSRPGRHLTVEVTGVLHEELAS